MPVRSARVSGPGDVRAGGRRAAGARDRWYPFAPGTIIRLTLPDAGSGDRSVRAWACAVRPARAMVIVPIEPVVGAPALVPLETIDAAVDMVAGRVESSVPAGGGEHRVLIRFDNPIEPTRYAVCWGVSLRNGGVQTEIPPSEATWRRSPGAGSARASAERARFRAQNEHAANVITVSRDLARRAAEGASDDELREIAGLLDTLLSRGAQPPGA